MRRGHQLNNRVLDPLHIPQGVLDTVNFDTPPGHLDLPVSAARKMEHAVFVLYRQIAGEVERAEFAVAWVRDESPLCRVRALKVFERNTYATNGDLTCFTGFHRGERVIKQNDIFSGHCRADGNRTGGNVFQADLVQDATHASLCRAEAVEKAQFRPGLQQFFGHGNRHHVAPLLTDPHRGEGVNAVSNHQMMEPCVPQRDGDLVADHRLRHLVDLRRRGFDKGNRRARDQRHKRFRQGAIAGDRCSAQHDVVRPQCQLRLVDSH